MKLDYNLIPPHSLGAEKSILSSCLNEAAHLDELLEQGFTDAHFYLPAHRALFNVLKDWRRDEREFELITLIQYLADAGRLDVIGGPQAIYEIYTYAPHHGHFERHAEEVREKKFRRDVQAWAGQLQAAAMDPDAAIQDMLAQPVDDLIASRFHSRSLATGSVGVDEWLDDWKAKFDGQVMDIITCGIPQLDQLRGGIDNPGLTYVGAFPSSGKTAMLVQMMVHLIRDPDSRVLIFSLEMTRRQLIQRAMMHLCQFQDSRIITEPEKGAVTKGDMLKIRDAAKILDTDRLIIEDQGGISIDQIEARVKVEQRKGPLTMIGVDYVQQVTCQDGGDSGVEQRMTKITRGLQRVMKSSRAAVIGLSQLTQDSNGHIKMKYANSLEEDADLAIRIERARDDDEVTGFKVMKDRQRGHRGAFLPCFFNKRTQTFQPRSQHV